MQWPDYNLFRIVTMPTTSIGKGFFFFLLPKPPFGEVALIAFNKKQMWYNYW